MKLLSRAFVLFCIAGSLLCAAATLLRAQAVSGGATSTPVDLKGLSEKLAAMQQQIDRLTAEVKELKKRQGATASPSASAAATAAVVRDSGGALKQHPAAPPNALAGAAPSVAGLLRSTQISGFVDAYYGYDFNEPSDRMAGFRVFDSPSNQFSLNLAELALKRNPSPDNAQSRLGFNLVFGFGNAVNVVNASDPGGPDFDRNVVQAYGSYLFDVGRGLQVDVGKFVTPAGAEVIESPDDWNYTRGLLFGYAIPFYHFGLRAKYAFNRDVSLTGYLVNGWNDVIDNNTGKTYGLSLAWTPDKRWSITQNYLAGPETPDQNRHWRQLTDTVVQFNATHKLSLLLNYDWGGGDRTPGRVNPVFWTGVAGYAHYAFNGRDALTTRYEYFDDHDGFTTLTPQSLNEFTETYEHIFGGHMITRLEFRRDMSNHPVFRTGAGLSEAQNTLTGGVIFTFDLHPAQ